LASSALSPTAGPGIAGAAPAKLYPDTASDLSRLKLLHDLHEGQLARMAPLLTQRSAEAGEFLSSEDLGEPGVSFLWRGRCRVTLLSPSGRQATIRLVQPGWHFGEISILAESEQSSHHIAFDQDSLLLRVSARDFRALMHAMPGLTWSVVRHIAQTAMARADRIYEFSLLDSRVRLQSELLRLARNGPRLGNVVTISPAPTHEALAAQIGLTREGVTRHLKSLADQGLVKPKRCEIIILDVKRLAANVAREAACSLSYPLADVLHP
jgi:CRP-like cAMP-binding protein